MKCLTFVIHQTAKQDLLDHLLDAQEIPGFTVSAAEGHSERTEQNPFETARDRVLGYVPRYRVEVILEDDAVDTVLERLQDCDSCVVGRGIWWVTPVESHGVL
jgi:nitrogen regulatory protein P-II 1